MRRIIGLDIGGTKCAVLLADASENIEIIKKIRFETRTDLGFDQTRDNLFKTVKIMISESDKPVEAIGISCGGPLNSRTGVIQSPPNLPGWDDIPLVSMLEKEFGIPTFLQNDANACALVEWKLGAGRGAENMIFLTMGTGMGAGIIADGRLMRGACDMAGEVGHMRLAQQGPMGYGKEGSFEGFCSGGGIARMACIMRKGWLAKGESVLWKENDASLTTKALADYAKSGDTHALEVFRAAGARLGEGIAILTDVLNPERIVIGGVFMRCEALLRDSMWETVHREALLHTWKDLQIVPAQTNEQIGDFAAVMVGTYGLENK